tara:strand:+ start:702 stop:1223 length:522 start_codon:yes stop_codon:yes gene_type:complete
MKIFITGNLQLGRPSAVGKWKRPFSTLEEMDKTIINNWNSVVTNKDVVYHLGNFAWDPKTAYDSILALKGKTKFFLLGENDQPLLDLQKKGTLPPNCKLIGDIHHQKNIDGILSYWPMKEWMNRSKGFWNVIGYPNKKYKTRPKDRIINCSTDQCNFKPQDINSMIGLLNEIE